MNRARRFRAAALDLDGTTLNSKGRLSAVTASVLEQMKQSGGLVIPAAARPPAMTLEVIDPSAMVCLNGALVVDGAGTVLAEATIPNQGLAEFLEAATVAVQGLGIAVFAGDAAAATHTYFDALGGTPRPGWVEVGDPAEMAIEPIHCASFRHPGASAVELETLLTTGLPQLPGRFSHSSPSVLDLLPVSASKAAGLQVVADHYGFPSEEVVAYGDMPNDIEMLSWAGLSVGVAGAHPDVLEIVDEVAHAADADGVAAHLADVMGLDQSR